MKAPKIMESKWRYLKMQFFHYFALTNPGNVQNQIITRISIFVALKIKDDGQCQNQKIISKNF